ncbi:mutS protein homolog 5-like isoform X1 [Dendronephthya gigantea]|uniref:mutS protein homolog 5-like isoform X1 n=2 Tax=Dendronephthya gigantea TaxID=151771 RepID=UPI00106C4B68|nr:mutS protein homolog 5-like isoform X1 [Dendronephthya gigantea]
MISNPLKSSTKVTPKSSRWPGDKANISSVDLNESDVGHKRMVNYLTSDSEEEQDEVIMSAIWSGGKLGSAYYDAGSAQLFMQMDILETQDFQFLKRLIMQVKPTTVVSSSNQDEKFLKVLQSEDENSEKTTGNNIPMEILPSIDFSLEICKRRILALNVLPSLPQHYTETERMMHLGSIVPFENTNMVKATGALIKYIDKKRIGVELEDIETKVPILALKTFSLEDAMMIDENTYSALQIFQKESHPSAFKGGSGAKEGLSLFGMMNMTKSVIGSRLLRVWFRRPTTNMDVLKQRQKAIAFFQSPQNAENTTSIQECLKHIKCISRTLVRMASAQASIGDWQSLYKTVYNAIYISNMCKAIPDVQIAQKIARDFSEDLHRIASLINKIVDFDDSTSQNRFVVKPGVDENLDEKKRTYNGLPDFMTKVAQEELSKLDASITECNILYLPQLGYLLAIPRTEQMKEEKDFEMEGLDFVFFSDNTAHYKSANTRELDRLLGDTLCEITDHETAIMHRLQSIVLEHTDLLLKVMEYTAELDCLIALSVHAKENNYACPEMTEENLLSIKAGRHPLQEIYVTPFVANDTQVDKEKSRMKILTGPNASGKSVYLKQVGLIVFLAHIGSFVPAESATIGITERIFTRIHTRETVSVGLSTFMIDLNQMASAVQFASERSLILIDEFGKGTATVDGLSLLTACLKYWLSAGNRCPKVLVSTHFHSIIQQKLLPLTPLLRFQTMETMQNGDELVFLYQLVDGYTNTSYACHIAALAGISSDLVQRGHEILDLIRNNKAVKRKDSKKNEEEMQRYCGIVNEFLGLDFESADVTLFMKTLLTSQTGQDQNRK